MAGYLLNKNFENLNGKRMVHKNITLQKGNHQKELIFEEFSENGPYLFSIHSGAFTKVYKLIILQWFIN